ncbi:arylsulfatase [Pelagicoccus sp. SDUM812005]|uniref:arylsulfatase n=1 Tax=Pelagicoccus sp. SDUM812005 TaxID=3041257 RepID=UPI00280E554E|nr:arylsulfatase [Pelagicoccus sp. SDUM812005]MDQ8183781.1 arylsulfatase [Pelagicoccus sp. SDUM812005]
MKYKTAHLPFLALLALSVYAHATSKPNIIFIMADDLGYGDVGFNEQERIKTPNLDQLAREGMVFTDHYSGSTVCMPSRGCLLTGKHLGHATIRGNPRWTASGTAVDLRPEDVTIAEELKRAGYHTGVVGKWGLAEASDDSLPTRQGFDYFYGYRNHKDAHHYYWPDLWENESIAHLPENDVENTKGKYVHDLLTDAALRFIDQNSDQPFFLYLAYTIPHYELTVPEDSKRQYQDLNWPERKMKKAHYRHDREGNVTYAGMVSRMDRDIGRLIERLQEQGLDEKTLVIFTSDNGPEYERNDRFFNSSGPLRGGKRDLYEGGIRVPFVARWPSKIDPGTKSDHVSAFWDFLPTACEIANIQPTDTVDGLSYLPTLLSQTKRQKQHDYLYWEFNEKQGPIQALRKDKWKAVRKGEQDLELYDLSKDLSEENDISHQHPEIARKLNQAIDAARTPHPEFPLLPIDRNKR